MPKASCRSASIRVSIIAPYGRSPCVSRAIRIGASSISKPRRLTNSASATRAEPISAGAPSGLGSKLLPRQRRRAEAIGDRIALLAIPDQQNDPADQRHQNDQQPPARAVDVVQTPHRDGEARQQHREREDHPNEVHDRDGDEIAHEQEQREPPEFRARRPAGEIGIFRKAGLDRGEEIHRASPLDAMIDSKATLRPSTSLRLRTGFSGLYRLKKPRANSPHPKRSRRALVALAT